MDPNICPAKIIDDTERKGEGVRSLDLALLISSGMETVKTRTFEGLLRLNNRRCGCKQGEEGTARDRTVP